MVEKLPLVTIITPTYNRANYLTETMQSVLSQNYPNLEYIVVDDGSTDNTEKIVHAFQKRKYFGKKIIYVKQKNIGETKSVNKGFTLSHGKILAVVNSDDPLLPGAVKQIITLMQQFPDFLTVYPDWEKIDEKGKIIEKVTPSDYSYFDMLAKHYCMMGPGTFFRKEAIALTKGRDKRFHYIADFAFWLTLGLYGQMYHIPKTLATFRVHSDSQGIKQHGKRMAEEHVQLLTMHFKEKMVPQEAQKLKRKAYASAYYHGASETTSFIQKIRYYAMSLLLDPFTVLQKLTYEGIKIKKRLAKK